MRLAVLVVVCLLLAGCAKEPSRVQEAPEPTVAPVTGAISGVVVDGAIIPLQGVAVKVGELTTETDAQGRFTLAPLPEGAHFVQFSKAGYFDQELTATVGGELLNVKMVFARDTTPRVEAMQWDGHLVCSLTAATLFFTGCGLGEQLEDHGRHFDMISSRPAFIQSELDWDPTIMENPLCMRQYASSGVGGDNLGDVCGSAPLIATIDEALVESSGLGNTRGLERVVWATSMTEAPTAGLAFDQPFTVYTHLFFHFQPTLGWTFLGAGDHPTP